MLRSLAFSALKSRSSSLLLPDTLSMQQIRTTFVLKRRFEPLLHKKGAARPKRMRSKNYVYDLVTFKENEKKQPLSIVLTAFSEGVGRKGDVVSIPPSKAYKEFLLPGLAVYDTPENRLKYASTDEKDEKTYSSKNAKYVLDYLQTIQLDVPMNLHQPWTIEPWHIRCLFRKMGVYMPETAIELPKEPITGPDLSKEGKSFYVTVTINNCEKAKVHCRLHHWSTDPVDRLPYKVEHWKEPVEVLFGEEATTTPTTTSEKPT